MTPAFTLSAFILSAYLIGSIPFGLLIAKTQGKDIRKVGSGNIGATNVLRCLGKPLGITCFVLDVLKGFLPAFVFPMLGNIGTEFGIAFGAAAILGHNFPIFLKFKGGKGVATSAGVLLGVAPLAVLIGILTWATVFFSSGYVSLGSIIAAIAVAVTGWVRVGHYGQVIAIALTLLGALTIWRHRSNIQRLIAGTENKFERKKKIMNCFVIGNGGWGTALGMTLASNGHNVTIWGPFEEEIQAIRAAGENTVYLPGVPVPESIQWSSDPTGAEKADLIVLVVPSRFVRSTLETFKPHLKENVLMVSATKGLDEKTHQRISQIAQDVLNRDIAILSGPSHAEEVARGVPTAVTVAGENFQTLEKIQTAFLGKTFRVYTSDDVIGVELGGTLKNIIAVAAGILDGMGLGDNSKAALMTRGLAEISRLGAVLGAKPETFSGLSGIGDLIVTCASQHSRNRAVGERLGKGESLQDIMGGMKQVAEGVWNAKAARDLAKEHGIDMPITEEVCAIVEEGKDPRQALKDLMSRDPKAE